MSDPIKELSESGWIAEHRKLYLEDGVAGHMWDSTVGGQMLLAHAVESSVAQYGRANRAIRPPEVALAGANPTASTGSGLSTLDLVRS